MDDEEIKKLNGQVNRKNCRFIDDKDPMKGMVCESPKGKMTCKFRRIENPDGSIDGILDCHSEKKE